MHKIFTKEDVLLYIYDELNDDETLLFENVLLNSSEFQKLYVEIIKMLDVLNQKRPSKLSLNLIRSYASSLSVDSTVYKEKIDFFLN